MRGELRFNTLPELSLVRIGEGLTTFSSTQCECVTPRDDQPCEYERTTDTPPPGATWPIGWQSNSEILPPRGAADVPDSTMSAEGPIIAGRIEVGYNCIGDTIPGSFSGKIVIHANNTGLAHDLTRWQGSIVLGTVDDQYTPNQQPIVFDTFNDPNSSADDNFVGPLYQAIPGSPFSDDGFGTGAIGLVPFAIHRPASDLEEDGCGDAVINPKASLRSQINDPGLFCTLLEPIGQDNTVDIVFYGPVKQIVISEPPPPPFAVLKMSDTLPCADALLDYSDA
jgi:hypothetical protein